MMDLKTGFIPVNLSLPMFSELNKEQIKYIVSSITKFFEKLIFFIE